MSVYPLKRTNLTHQIRCSLKSVIDSVYLLLSKARFRVHSVTVVGDHNSHTFHIWKLDNAFYLLTF